MVKQVYLPALAPGLKDNAVWRMVQVNRLAKAVDFDMVVTGAVNGNLNCVSKARIFEAVREAKGE